jgi:dihydroorotase
VTVIDPNQSWKIDAEKFQSKSRNCPFNGWDVKGQARATIVAGEIKWGKHQNCR